MTDPKKPDASPAKPAAAPPAAKPTFRPLLDALCEPELSFSISGAALFLAHAILELGEAKLREMRPNDIRVHALAFLKRIPMAWPTFRMGNPMQLIRALDMYKVEHETSEYYQLEVARLTPNPMSAEHIAHNKAEMDRVLAQQAQLRTA